MCVSLEVPGALYGLPYSCSASASASAPGCLKHLCSMCCAHRRAAARRGSSKGIQQQGSRAAPSPPLLSTADALHSGTAHHCVQHVGQAQKLCNVQGTLDLWGRAGQGRAGVRPQASGCSVSAMPCVPKAPASRAQELQHHTMAQAARCGATLPGSSQLPLCSPQHPACCLTFAFLSID